MVEGTYLANWESVEGTPGGGVHVLWRSYLTSGIVLEYGCSANVACRCPRDHLLDGVRSIECHGKGKMSLQATSKGEESHANTRGRRYIEVVPGKGFTAHVVAKRTPFVACIARQR